MERRLIKYGSAETPEVRSFEAPLDHPVMRDLEASHMLALDAGMPLVREAVSISENENARNMRISRCFEDIPRHVNMIASAYGAHFTPERKSLLLQQLGMGDAVEQDVEAILEALTVPAAVENGFVEGHRYLRGRETPEGYRAWYGINFDKVEADKKLLAGIRQAKPELAADLMELENALNEYARPDPSLPMDRWGIVHENKGDKQIKGMAKFAGIVVAAAATVFTGAMTLGGKESFTAPLLYAGVTGLLAAPPSMWRQVFGSQSENVIAQINGAMSPKFKDIVHDYGVAGPRWQAFVDDVMGSPSETKTALRELSKHPVDSPEYAQALDEYVNGAMPAGDEREALRQMILDGRFDDFTGNLMDVTREDARGVVSEYVGRGAGMFAGLAAKSADEANRLFNNAPRSYLGGNLGADA